VAGRGDNRDMPTRHHYRRPNPDRGRALELLAGSRYGYTKAILRAHGFSIDMMVELVKARLATTKRERMVADGRSTLEATRYLIPSHRFHQKKHDEIL